MEVMDSGDYKFMEFITEHGKSYGTRAEFDFRAALFKENMEFVEKHNADKNETHTVELNEMADWTHEEYTRLLGFKQEERERNEVELDVSNLADSMDWRTKGAVTPVKNQGHCGSCWAFSSTGSIEGAYHKKHGSLKSFSEQQLVDCAQKTGNHGCKGGLMDNAFRYIEMGNPLMEEKAYPYTAKDGRVCKYEKSEGVGSVASHRDVSRNSAPQLKAALAIEPVSIAVEADKKIFQMYKSGVITSSTCGTKLDHGVLAVGYGTLDGEDFFLVKNSWGASWGDHGYLRIGQKNVCGILMSASYPME
jgi:cathepsin L